MQPMIVNFLQVTENLYIFFGTVLLALWHCNHDAFWMLQHLDLRCASMDWVKVAASVIRDWRSEMVGSVALAQNGFPNWTFTRRTCLKVHFKMTCLRSYLVPLKHLHYLWKYLNIRQTLANFPHGEEANIRRMLERLLDWLCRARDMLNNTPLVARLRCDTSENELSEFEIQWFLPK